MPRATGCKHVFVQGEKKGTKCGRGCRGDYCKDHKQTKKEKNKVYQKELYAKVKEKHTNEILGKITVPDKFSEANKMKSDMEIKLMQYMGKRDKLKKPMIPYIRIRKDTNRTDGEKEEANEIIAEFVKSKDGIKLSSIERKLAKSRIIHDEFMKQFYKKNYPELEPLTTNNNE